MVGFGREPSSWLTASQLLTVSCGRESKLWSLSLVIRTLIPTWEPHPHGLI